MAPATGLVYERSRPHDSKEHAAMAPRKASLSAVERTVQQRASAARSREAADTKTPGMTDRCVYRATIHAPSLPMRVAPSPATDRGVRRLRLLTHRLRVHSPRSRVSTSRRDPSRAAKGCQRALQASKRAPRCCASFLFRQTQNPIKVNALRRLRTLLQQPHTTDLPGISVAKLWPAWPDPRHLRSKAASSGARFAPRPREARGLR
jgi:hypothetical protein